MQTMVATPSKLELTLEERNEMEMQFDGPITEAAIQDKIRARGAYAPVESTPLELNQLIRWARNDLKFYRGRVDELVARIADAIVERDGATYAASELDRKNRHIASMNVQLDGLKAHMRPYEVIIADAQAKMDAMNTQSIAAE